MPTALLNRPATVPDVLAAGEFKSDLHPRGPHGRWTKSFTKALTAAERKRADKAQAAFKARDFDAASLKQWQGNHTAEQLAAIKRFAGGDWKTINADLRAGHDTQHPDIAQLDASMHPLPHDVTLHRTVPVALFGGVDPEKLSGRKVKDAGYASTSIHEPVPGGGAEVRMHISAPAGTPAMPTGENGEVVLPRDQEMVIESVKADGHGGYDMQLTVLPKPGTRTPAAPKPAKKTAPGVEPSPGPKAVPPVKKPPRKRATPKRAAPAPTAKPEPSRSQPTKEPVPSPASPSELEALAADTGHGKTTVKLAGGMSAETSLVTLADGRQAVFKRAPEWGDPQAPKTQADAEHLASVLAAAIGAPAPGVVKSGDDAVWMAYLHGKTAGQILDTGTPDERAQYRALLDGPDGVRLGLLDVLVGNADRNEGNSIMSGGKLFGIDHGFSWEMYSDEPGVDQLGGDIGGRPVQHFVGRDEQGRWQLVDNPLTQADITEARQRLDALRPQFRAAGREKWLDRSLKILDQVAAHAKGPVAEPGTGEGHPAETSAVPSERAKPYHLTLAGIEDLAHSVDDGFPPKERRALTGGVSAETELVTLKDGTKVVHKYGGNPAAEQAASMIGRALGLEAPRTYRDSSSGVYMDYVADAQTADQFRVEAMNTTAPTPVKLNQATNAFRERAVQTDDGKLIGLLDLMIANIDRNGGNWMVDHNGRVIPIDHGHAFPGVAVGAPGTRVRAKQLSNAFTVHYEADAKRWIDNPLTAADVAEIRQRLEGLRPDFEHFDAARWLDYALAVLDGVEPHATGETNLVAGVR